ncbi:DUF4231 domain-containing protein [Actinomadura barringtoniae]|uniref:DUF4231 domain-containing protein n=1 Tax=Actinomadura barringtoniae TaxID=1427535 RepID=UPI0027DADC0C|nr:DUF4231 domain-containing protein [Actinomadura barringtoniae]
MLTRDGLPELYRAASRISRRGQRRVVQLNLVLILAGLASGIFALFGGQDGPAWHAWADAMAALWFAVAAVGGAMLNAGRAHRRWFDGRAAAESTKTLTWKYVMRAEPFEDDSTADALFIERLGEIRPMIHGAGSADGVRGGWLLAPDRAISPMMRSLRNAEVPDKRAVYRTHRLADQIRWYQDKAAAADHSSWRWRLATIVLGCCGVAGATARAAGWSDLDALGLAAAGLASIAAWTQLRQYMQNAAAYRLALRELLVIHENSGRPGYDQVTWGDFCERAEYAISREHTMWRARAG